MKRTHQWLLEFSWISSYPYPHKSTPKLTSRLLACHCYIRARGTGQETKCWNRRLRQSLTFAGKWGLTPRGNVSYRCQCRHPHERGQTPFSRLLNISAKFKGRSRRSKWVQHTAVIAPSNALRSLLQVVREVAAKSKKKISTKRRATSGR